MSTDEYAIPNTILRHFDLTVTPYNEAYSSEVKGKRVAYPDERLFFDQLLTFASLDGLALYPPTTPAAGRRLLHAIHSSDLDRLKQDCYFYYLLRDYDASTSGAIANGHLQNGAYSAGPDQFMSQEGEVSRAVGFAKTRCIPRTWRVFMDAYWFLDNAKWELAVQCLSDPSISDLNFVPQIIYCLSTLVSPPSRSMELVYRFLCTTMIPLDKPLDQDIKLVSLASGGSIAEAFGYIRQHEELDRVRMRERIWSWALGASPVPCGAGPKGVHPRALKELLHLPLNAEEHAHLLHFLSHPPRTIQPPALSALHDLVTLRLIHQGQYAEALQLDKASAGSAGTDMDRQRRREMVREFIAILPIAQRRALEIDGVERSKEDDVDMVNGHTEEQAAEPDRPPFSFAQEKFAGQARERSVSMNEGGIRPSGSHLSLAPSGSGSPARSPRPRGNSPFTGPPRFAKDHLDSPAPMQRVLSGSPFALPSNRVVSRNASPLPRVKRIINDDDEMAMDSPSMRPRNLSIGSMSRRDVSMTYQATPNQRNVSLASRNMSPRPDVSMAEAALPAAMQSQGAHVDGRKSDMQQQPTAQEEVNGDSVEDLEHDDQPIREPDTEPEPVPHPQQAAALSRSSRRRPPPKKPIKPPSPAPDEASQEKTPEPPSPPPSPPSHRTRSHDTPSSPSHSIDVAQVQSAPRSTRRKRGGRRSMPGAFDPREEPTIPEEEAMPPTPAPTESTRKRRGAATASGAQTEPPRSRITRSSSRALLDEDEAQGPAKRTRRNVRESSVVSAVSQVSETPVPDRTTRAGSLVRRSTRGKASSQTRPSRARATVTPASDRGSPTPSGATSTAPEPTRRGHRRQTSLVSESRGATSSRRTTRRRN